MPTSPNRRHSPAAERNGPPILHALQRLLPHSGSMLEIASGTGQHAAQFSAGLPGWQWQPTDFDEAALPSISAWCADRPNVRPPFRLDVRAPSSSPALPNTVDAVFCANMIHIAPWEATAALMQLAARHLVPTGLLITYGPYLEDDVPTSPGNAAFDLGLRARDPSWGLRRVADVAAAAQQAGLGLLERVAMPANNLLLVWASATREREIDLRPQPADDARDALA